MGDKRELPIIYSDKPSNARAFRRCGTRFRGLLHTQAFFSLFYHQYSNIVRLWRALRLGNSRALRADSIGNEHFWILLDKI